MSNLRILKLKNDFLRIKASHNSMIQFSRVNSHIYSFSKFSDFDSVGITLPLMVSGRLITAGVYNEPKYGEIETPADELKRTYKKWEGIKIYKSHAAWLGIASGKLDVSVDSVVGKILNTSWNEDEKAVDYVAAIYDLDIAMKIANDLIDSVSAGFTFNALWEGKVPSKKDIEPRELSLVFNPKDKKASIKVKRD